MKSLINQNIIGADITSYVLQDIESHYCQSFSEVSFLTHMFSIHPFSTPWKNQKTLRFSDVFRG